MELPRGWNKIVRDSSGSVAPVDFYGAPAATRIVFKLLNNVFSDFTATASVTVSQLVI